jgi:predicted nucleic acid-binding protein
VLALEYEATCRLLEHRHAAGLTAQASVFVDGVIAMVEAVEPHYLWRPQLRDPSGELVLEAAVNGRAEAIVTFNKRDFGAAPARFGVALPTRRHRGCREARCDGHRRVSRGAA